MANAYYSVVGGQMNRGKTLSLLPILLLTVLSLTACSGPYKAGLNPPGTGTATVNLTLVSDTPPASPSLLSYKLTVLSVTLTPATGTAFTFTPSPAPVIELMRLQSDTAFLGTLLNVPVGTYNSITVSLGSPQITFLNNTSATITNASSASGSCTVGAICTISPNATGLPKISFPITLSSNGQVGVGIDFNLSNSVTVTGGTMTVTFTPATAGVNVLSAFNLPRNSNLTGNQLDLIEDFVGVVSVSSQSVTLTSQTRGTLAASTTSTTAYDQDPSSTLCLTPSSACVVASQVASFDAILNSDGTLSIQEFEPLLSAQQDVVEGTVAAVTQNSQTQFTIVTTDKIKAATNSLIGVLNVGDLLTVNLVNAKPFLVDTKGLQVSQNFNGIFINFANATTTGAIHPGQTVAVHLTSFTAATASAPASSNTDTVTLRWSRLTGTPTSQPGPTFNFTNIPGYFNLSSASSFEVQTFVGTAGADGVTNLEGITNVNAIDDTKPVALRALYLQNPTNTAAPVFFAAKVRQH
jgi:Domain of unknown function (DUF4382)